MQMSEIISLSRALAYTAETEATDTDVLLGVNIAYRDIRESILKVEPNYDTLTWEATFEAGRSAYGVPEDTALMLGVRMVRSVELIYRDGADALRAREVSAAMWRDKESLQDWSEHDCVWALVGNILHVGPTPVADVENGLRIIGTPNVASLTLSTAENEIALPKTYHRILALSAAGYLFARRGMMSEKEQVRAEFEEEKAKMIGQIRNRGEESIEMQLPFLGGE